MDSVRANDKGEGRQTSVELLYKTMLQRDPGKRRVKPVEKHLLQLHFNMSESDDDDSDFEFNPADVGDNDDDDDDDDVDENESASEGSGSELSSPVAAVPAALGRVASVQSEPAAAAASAAAAANANQMEPWKPTEVVPKLAVADKERVQVKVLICSICLGERSDADDEIIECDGCGILVHEGCYGVTESLSNSSSSSSGSMEPWFCDACKAGATPSCELCPNFGGIFKQTDTGRWVHLVCALYVPGVAFGDVDKLINITLLEMPYSRWGAKACSLCEDEHFSQTGVCVGCDAGMCRNYFHVSCAQREGLLSEASPDQEDIADPFYAHCKLHADKQTMKVKKRNWLAVRSHVEQFKERGTLVSDGSQSRVQRKLAKCRRKFLTHEAARPPAWVNPIKQPRPITSSATALRRLMKKASMLGITTQAPSMLPADIRKRAYVAPALSVDFAAYFHERNGKIATMQKQLMELSSQNVKLQEQESSLRKRYEELICIAERQAKAHDETRSQGLATWQMMKSICSEIKLSVAGMKGIETKMEGAPMAVASLSSAPDGGVIHPCGICKTTQDQHLLAECDKCRLHYHLGCLDPPLVRMPRKTKQQGWQCSQCIANDFPTRDEAPMTDPSAPRRLRESIKEPVKFALPTPKLQVERMRDKSYSGEKGRRAGSAGRGRKAKRGAAMAHGRDLSTPAGKAGGAAGVHEKSKQKACKREVAAPRPSSTRGKRAKLTHPGRSAGALESAMPGLFASGGGGSSHAPIGGAQAEFKHEPDDELPVLKKEKHVDDGQPPEDDDDDCGSNDDDDYNPEDDSEEHRAEPRRSGGGLRRCSSASSSDSS